MTATNRAEEMQNIVDRASQPEPTEEEIEQGAEVLANNIRIANSLPHDVLAFSFGTMATYFRTKHPESYAEFVETIEMARDLRSARG